MKTNWMAFVRLQLLCMTICFLLKSAGVNFWIICAVGFALGVVYPEPVFVPINEKKLDEQ